MAEPSDDQQGRLEPRRDKPIEEADVYELNLDEDEPAAPPARSKPAPPKPGAGKPGSPSKPAPAGSRQKPPASAADAGEDTYELAESDQAPKAKKGGGALRPELDPRLADREEGGGPPAPAAGTSDAAERAAAAGTPIPKLYQSEPEPAYTDPTVAASRREQARIRAAQQLAEEEAARRKRKLIIAGVLLLLALLIFVWTQLF